MGSPPHYAIQVASNEYLIGEIHYIQDSHLKIVSRFTTKPLKSITGITNKGETIFAVIELSQQALILNPIAAADYVNSSKVIYYIQKACHVFLNPTTQ